MSVEKKWVKLSEKPVGNVDDHWNKVKEIIVDKSNEILGQKPKLSDDTLQLTKERRQYKSMRKDSPEMAKHHNYLCRAVRRSAKKDKEYHVRSVCKEVQEARAQNKMRAVYQGL